jgi:GT2 family glycosyltransferase
LQGRARLQEHRAKLLQSKQEAADSSEELGENARLRAESASSRRELRATQWRLERVAERARETIDWQADRVDLLAAELFAIRKSRAWRFGQWLGRVVGLGGAQGVQADRNSLIQSILEEREAAAKTEPCSPGVRRSSFRRIEVLNEFKRNVSDPPSADGMLDLISEERFTEFRETLLRRRQGILVSIVLTKRGKSDLVSTALDSARDQSYTNWELIFVDDGSDPDFVSEIDQLAARDPRIRRVHATAAVMSAMRNEGLQNATGSVAAFLDPDGYWEPDFLLFLVNALLESGAGCGYAGHRVVRSGQEAVIETYRPVFNLSRLQRHSEIDLGSFVFRAVLAEDLGGFDESLEWCDDWDLILRYVTSHPPAQVAAVLATCVERHHDKRQLGLAKACRHAVLNRHAIDWRRLEAQAGERVHGHVTIVIPVFGQIAATKSCLQSIAANQPESDVKIDVVVVDNGNAEPDRKELREIAAKRAECELVESEENYGFGLGCNLGFARSRGEFVVFLNSDTEVSPGWLEALLEPFTNDPEIGIVGPKLLYPDGTLQCGGLAFNDRSVMPYHIYRGFPGAHEAVNKARYFQAVTGACLALRAADFARLRGFDPIFINGCEDIDFCLRMQRDLGKLVFYNPVSVVRHSEGLSVGRNRFIVQNRKIFADRWRGAVMDDDQVYYLADGLKVDRYVKPGREPDGDTAIYVPVFAVKSEARPDS